MKKYKEQIIAAAIMLVISIAVVLIASSIKSPTTPSLIGTAEGFGGDITVSVKVVDGKITSLTAKGPNETETIGGKALPTLVEETLKKGTIEGVDTVSGATYTSKGFFNAVRVALGEEIEKEETTTTTPTVKEDLSEASGWFGLGVSVTTSAKSAADGADGSAEQDIYLAAIVVDQDGKIVKCKFDVAQDKLAVTANGTVSDKDKTFTTKQNLAEAYGMKKASSIGKEWYEQADALAQFYVGKTLEEIKGLAKDENGKYTDVDLRAGCTMGHMDSFEAAIADAFDRLVVAENAVSVGIGTKVSASDSADATADADGKAYFYSYVTGTASDKDGKVVACAIDAVQVTFAVKADGTVTAPESVQSKDQIKEGYGMKKASSIGKEWYEQAAFLANSLVGKTKEEVLGVNLTDGKAADADLLAGCTMGHLGDILEAVVDGMK